jgi:hypothetical protein
MVDKALFDEVRKLSESSTFNVSDIKVGIEDPGIPGQKYEKDLELLEQDIRGNVKSIVTESDT